jgi:hypothetical protein
VKSTVKPAFRLARTKASLFLKPLKNKLAPGYLPIVMSHCHKTIDIGARADVMQRIPTTSKKKVLISKIE